MLLLKGKVLDIFFNREQFAAESLALQSGAACLPVSYTHLDVYKRQRFVCNIPRVKVLFTFGWKLLVSGLLDTLYQDLSSLIIGKKYSSDTLGFYNRGKQFPQFIINAINGSVQSVLLPAMSGLQEHESQVKQLMRNAIMDVSYTHLDVYKRQVLFLLVGPGRGYIL